MRLERGMLIETNYSGPYRIKGITRGCVCVSFLDELNCRPNPRPPHIHMVCTRPDGSGEFYLNGWIEEELRSCEKSYCGRKTDLDYDHISVLPDDREVQFTMF